MTLSTFEDPHGVAVAYRRWVPLSPRGIALVLHGASEHSGRYARLANALVADGWAVYAPDHRGHGITSRSTGRGAMGPGGMDGLLGDIHQLRDVAQDEHGPELPVVVIGHSMGSLLALGYLGRHGAGVRGCVLSGSPGIAEGAAVMADAIQQMVDAGMADERIDALSPFNESFEPARTPFDWLSRDEAEVDAYLADPDCGDSVGMTYGFLAEMLSVTVAATSVEGLERIPTEVPFLLLTGAADPVSMGGVTVQALEQALRDTGHEVSARYYPDARHEVLNETNRDEVTADAVGWLRELR